MRHIKVRNAAAVEAEISAKAYKKLCAKLKGYNRKQLWSVLDHYVFHTMEDHHVEELLKILDHFERTNSFDEQPPKVVAEAAAAEVVEEVDAPLAGVLFDDIITAEDMERSKKQMDLLYDVTYFTYLTPEVAQANAQKLVEYAAANDIPTQPHWHLIAASTDFLNATDEE
jgi:hypothetical protein